MADERITTTDTQPHTTIIERRGGGGTMMIAIVLLIAVAIGVPAGVFAAVKRGSWLDQTIMGTALVGYSMPIFWWGLLLIIFFSGTLGWTPVSGRISLMYFFPPVTGG